MKYRVFTFLFISNLLLTGCVQQQIIDDVNIETALGYDTAGGKKIKGTVLIPQYLPNKSVQNTTLVTTGRTTRELSAKFEKKTNKKLERGSLEMLLFGQNLAKQGFFEMISSFQRDPNLGSRIGLAMTDGEALDVLQGLYGSQGNGIFIKDLLEHNMKSGDVPEINLHLFSAYHETKGRTTFMPIIKKISNNQLKINGIALFNNKRLVQTIPANEMFYFKLMVDKNSQRENSIKSGSKFAVIRSIASKRKIKIHKNEYQQPTLVEVDIDITGTIREFTGKKLNHKEEEKVKNVFNQKVKRVTMAMLKEFQQKGIDPVGVGNRVKSVTRNFNWKKWKNDYKNVQFIVNSNITITESGEIQ
jgi:spore germination protein